MLLLVHPSLFSRLNKTQFLHVFYISNPSSCCSPPPFLRLAHNTTMRLWCPKLIPAEPFPTQKTLFSCSRKTSFSVTWAADDNSMFKLQCICFWNSMTLLPHIPAMSIYCCWAHCSRHRAAAQAHPTPPSRLLQSVKITLSSKHLLRHKAPPSFICVFNEQSPHSFIHIINGKY